MFKLTRAKYDGMTEVKQIIAESQDKKDLEKILAVLSPNKSSCYLDSNGEEWYLEIEVESEKVTKSNKTEKIEIRVDHEIKDKIKKASAKLGLSVSAYLVMLASQDIQKRSLNQ